MGAALALECTGRVATPLEGMAIASTAIDDGRAAALLDKIGALAP
jgi:anthranilate phosphoribosyltransferase